MDDIFTNENLAVYSSNLHFTLFSKYNNIVNIRTITEVFVFSQRGSDKTLFTIKIKLLVSYHHFFGIDIIKNPYFRFSLSSFSISFDQMPKIINSIINQMSQMIFYFRNISLENFYFLLSLINVKF